jgi:uncharacterized membrane protein
MNPAGPDQRPAEVVSRRRRLFYLLGPFALTAAVLGVVYLVTDVATLHEIWIAGLVSLLGAGTTVVFGDAALGDTTYKLKLDATQLALVVMYINAVSGWFYTYNMDLMNRLPRIGPWIRKARRNARGMVTSRPWIRRWAVLGVCLFVITPLPGSGALGGALVGRIVGITRRATVAAIAIAGVIICTVYALLAQELKSLLDRLEQFTPFWVRIAVFVLVAAVMVWLMTRLVRWLATHPVEEDADGA